MLGSVSRGDWQNGHKGVCGGIHFRPEASMDACITARLTMIIGWQALFPDSLTGRMVVKKRNVH
jgi:hypothetical protein